MNMNAKTQHTTPTISDVENCVRNWVDTFRGSQASHYCDPKDLRWTIDKTGSTERVFPVQSRALNVVVVNDMYTIGRTSEVRLVQRLLPDDSLQQVSGVRRPVSKFILKCGGDIGGLGGLVIANAKLVKERNKRRRDNTMKKMGQVGTDIFSAMLL
ncbi:hypothetical protein THAOC_17142 [Thalassiosira oceanica]|uniref:Uncharacterized protein n=1 Tax=Thalassiosira oceanica TaxID=159749 RepID=K0S841_THAOC|nr:hypothetical protein THAOC_17142 [Thalassiosira oceanica]|eukprot:EJK62253.1 hypothetical protein THAOC_17142 [Thalassiosira oceanica]